MASQEISLNKPRVLVIGVGNAYRRDDAVGLIVTRRVREAHLHGVRVLEESGEGAALMEAWKGTERVILIDAVASGSEPGTLHRFEAHKQSVSSRFFHCSTHAFSVAEAIELARALNQLPPCLIVYGIEGKDFSAGENLSPEVERAAEKAAESVLQDIQSLRKCSSDCINAELP